MVSYNIKERPRCTGKTIELKLRVLEDLVSSDAYFYTQIIITPNQNMASHFINWRNNFVINTSDIEVCSTINTLRNILRGISGRKRIAVYIEEPFMLEYHKQAEIITELEDLGKRNNVVVFGIGTQKPEESLNQILKNKMES